AFERQRGKDGGELYRMLWGYSKENLADGAAAKLVEYLDHDNMDFRVLAFHNLHQVVGATFNYRPEQTAARNQRSRPLQSAPPKTPRPPPTTPPAAGASNKRKASSALGQPHRRRSSPSA